MDVLSGNGDEFHGVCHCLVVSSYSTGADFTDLSLFFGLKSLQSDSWLSISLFVKLTPGFILKSIDAVVMVGTGELLLSYRGHLGGLTLCI